MMLGPCIQTNVAEPCYLSQVGDGSGLVQLSTQLAGH